MKTKLSIEQKKEIDALKALPDDKIDTSDIFELDEKYWKKAIRNPVYKPKKKPTTIRIDEDVLVWAKGKGRGWQTTVNKILRQTMLKELR